MRPLKTILILGIVLLTTPAALAQQRAQRKPAVKSAAPTARAAEPPKLKGVWEPVNYPEDLRLTDVFFVNEEEGWVSGDGGTILHTSDGGTTWTPQLGGDPQSQETPIYELRFVDARHGWALEEPGAAGGNSKLLRTTDGENWEHVGTVQLSEVNDYAFTSPQNGVLLAGNANVTSIYHTRDAGRTWKEVFAWRGPRGNDCRAKLQIEGLVQELTCRLYALHMVSPLVGYATGDFSRFAPTTLAVLKTEDGGATWGLGVVDVGDAIHGGQQRLFFKDEATGFLSQGEKLLTTTDGGKSWRGVVATAGAKLHFADPEVGWALYAYHGWRGRLGYTTDGGKRWASRDIPFPAQVYGLSFPRRDRAYVVGAHGMVYRYRVVPVSYSNPKGIEAPAMPALSDELTPDLADIRESAGRVQNKLGGPKTGAMHGAGQPAAETGGDFIQDCCSSEIADLESDVGSFVEDVPMATGRYRTLNLIVAGLRMASDLINQASAMRDSIRTLKSASNRDAALLALRDLLGNVDSAGQTLAGGFDSPPPLPDVPPQGARAPQPATPERNAPTTASQPAQTPDKPTLQRSDKVMEAVKKKLKLPKIPF